jgi:hypothetical protein
MSSVHIVSEFTLTIRTQEVLLYAIGSEPCPNDVVVGGLICAIRNPVYRIQKAINKSSDTRMTFIKWMLTSQVRPRG